MEYRLITYHVNIGVGDATIIVKVGSYGKAEKYILVDGGLDHAEPRARKNIYTAMDEIFKIHGSVQGNETHLMFHLVVITHWDRDHWGGIGSLIQQHQEEMKKLGPQQDFKRMPFRFINNVPATEMIAPREPIDAEDDAFGFWGFLANPNNPNNPNEMFVSYTHSDGQMYQNILKGTMGYLNIIGWNICDDGSPVGFNDATRAAQNTPAHLLETHKVNRGLFVVGCDQYILGSPLRISGKNDKNSTSIALMWIVKHGEGTHFDIKIPFYTAGDLNGGAEVQLAEWAMGDPTQAPLPSTVNTYTRCKSIDTIKASHHGSKGSTFPEFLDIAKPESIIFSSGVSYGHPSWELLFMLHSYFSVKKYQHPSSPKPIHAVCFPYWIQRKVKDGRFEIPKGPGSYLNYFTDKYYNFPYEKPEFTHYHQRLADYYTQLNNLLGTRARTADLVQQFVAYVKTQFGLGKLIDPSAENWVGKASELMWNDLSDVSASFHAIPGAGKWIVDGSQQNSDGMIEMIQVTHVSNSDDNPSAFKYITQGAAAVNSKYWLGHYYRNPFTIAPPHIFMMMAAGTGTQLPDTRNTTINEEDVPIVTNPDGSEIWYGRNFRSLTPVYLGGDQLNNQRLGSGVPMIPDNLISTYPGGNPDEMDSEISSATGDAILVAPPGIADEYRVCTPLPTNGFFCLSTALDPPQGSSNLKALQSGPLDTFVTCIETGLLAFSEDTLQASTQMGLAEFDELAKWFKLSYWADPPIFTLDGNQEFISVAVRTRDVFDLYFSTDPTSLSSSFDMTPITENPTLPDFIYAPGIMANENIMVFGLDLTKTKPIVTSLGEVIEYSNLTKILGPVLKDILKVIPLQLDLAAIPEPGDETPGTLAKGGARNALWFMPGEHYKTVLRLQFSYAKGNSLVDSLGALKNYLPIKNFDINNLRIVSKKTASLTVGPKARRSVLESRLDFVLSCKILDTYLNATLSLQPTVIELNILFKEGNILKDIIDWVVGALSIDSKEINLDELLKDENVANNVQFPSLRQLSLVFAVDPSTGEISGIQSVRFDLEIQTQLGAPKFDSPSDKPKYLAFLVTYTWSALSKSLLRGSLWFKPRPALTNMAWAPLYETYHDLQPSAGEQALQSLDLRTIIPGGIVDSIPEGLPTIVTQAGIEITTSSIEFMGEIVSEKLEQTDSPKFQLGKVFLNFSYDWKQKQPSLVLEVLAGFFPPKTAKIQKPSQLYGSIEYNASGWLLKGSAANLNIGNLYSLFDADCQDGVMDVMEKITLRRINLVYQYTGKGKSSMSQFSIDGQIVFGPCILKLDYKYNPGGVKGWDFMATFDVQHNSKINTTVGDMIQSIMHSDDEDDLLPPFLSEIPIKLDGNVTQDLIGLNLKKVPSQADDPGSLCFVAHITIHPIQLVFTQIRAITPKGIPAGTKRIIKIAATALPEVTVPMIGNLTQPFDEMFFLWVQDTSPEGKGADIGKPKGVTFGEIQKINSTLQGLNLHQMMFKSDKKPNSGGSLDPSTIVLESGWHFILVVKNMKGESEVLMDYVFGKKEKPGKNPKPPGPSPPPGPNPTPGPKALPASSTAPKLAPVKKSRGPLSIENVGFQYKDKKLSILMDAKFLLGPIEFGLLGLKIGVKFGKREDGTKVNLLDIRLEDLEPSISGLAIAFDRPPVIVAGLFEKTYDETTKTTIYAGGVIVKFEPWMFQAAGFFGKREDADGFTSVFIFLKLNGPLISFGFADISGITGGFGYNVDLRWPDVSEVKDFPFVGTRAIESPLNTLRSLTKTGPTGWVNMKDGSMWLAAGLTVSAFQVLSVDAVLVVQWAPTVRIGLFAVATCDVPNTKASVKFAHIELGIKASIDPQAGAFKCEAQLSPNSYILHPDCHLTGGFALCYWWKPQVGQLEEPRDGIEGDWVFTVGGYHAAFNPPAHYPRPDRLRISWAWGSCISISGEAYFAVTPKVCMGGGRLHAALNVGLLSAWFDAYVDFLINYQPFHFQGDGGLAVGVKYTLDLWLVTLHINVEIKAQLHLEGPPMYGTVHVDFWVFGFDITFGDKSAAPKPLSLEAFYQMVLQTGTGTGTSITSGGSGDPAQAQIPHLFSCKKGALPSSKDGKNVPKSHEIWHVRGGILSFTVTSRFAFNRVNVNDKKYDDLVVENDLFAKPMQIKEALTSTLDIYITPSIPGRTMNSFEWYYSATAQSVPKGLWDKYDENQDPAIKGNGITELLNGGDVQNNVPTGIVFSAPDPSRSDDGILKYNAIEDMKEPVFGLHDAPPYFPEPKPSRPNEAWIPAPEVTGETQWDAASTAWSIPDAPVANLVDIFSDALYWNAKNDDEHKPTTKQETGDEPTVPKEDPLSTAPPAILIRDFKTLIIAAPLVLAI
ncbi:hypothetical protein AOL_s00210g77 [Orbilia oligospora ATCC 24927]|uniref:DUF6603 domain-containing protein n=1 Tax=Arthrobotrys oligospora (strain ATCC 24927 / CBS 115.81 / DSM 1491) TaxID=756982 RepID=G1XRM2_ARTOA|nr:hypothetical protein AOL_s00210g77 [Orbilia oligospora ATCC 24927]EGX44205.1 hypothetical protein AOL_s00210g77 [Orbilia oligospora ATCC 24927]